ncbi:MAG: hypothetical protein HZB65_03840, partial [Candidatus Aenigmarchaeota archaeon]|nr:hypothetical protein [Candidatus Aenigmarchaeota archaeon]
MTFFESHLSCQGKKYYTFLNNKKVRGLGDRLDHIKDMTMKKAVRGKPLTKKEKKYNKTIAKIRSPGERPFA